MARCGAEARAPVGRATESPGRSRRDVHLWSRKLGSCCAACWSWPSKGECNSSCTHAEAFPSRLGHHRGSQQPCTAFSCSSPGQMHYPLCSWVISSSLEVRGLGRHPTPACLGKWQLCPGSQAKLKQLFLFSLDECCQQRGCTGRDPKAPESGAEQGETR